MFFLAGYAMIDRHFKRTFKLPFVRRYIGKTYISRTRTGVPGITSYNTIGVGLFYLY